MSSAQNITIRDDDFWRGLMSGTFLFHMLGSEAQRPLVQRLPQIIGLATWHHQVSETLEGQKGGVYHSAAKSKHRHRRKKLENVTKMGRAVVAAELLGLASTTQHVNHVRKTSKYQTGWKWHEMLCLIAQGKKLQRASSAPQAGNLKQRSWNQFVISGRGFCAGQLLSSAMGDRQCEGSRLPPGQAQAGGLDQQTSMSLDGRHSETN